MAEQSNTVHTVYTAEAQLQAAEAELREFSKKIMSEMGKVEKALGAADTRALKMAQNLNKAMNTIGQTQQTLNRLSVTPDRMGARSRNDIKGETASMVGDLNQYRRQVSRALAGTVLEIDKEISNLDKAYQKLASSRRRNKTELASMGAELDRLRRQRSEIASNPYVAAELTTARSNAAKADLKRTAADDRMATRAAEDLTLAKTRLLQVEAELSTLNARSGGSVPRRIKMLREETNELRQMIRTYEAVPAVMTKYERNKNKNLQGTLISQDKEMLRTAREHLRLEERSAELEGILSKYAAGRLQLDAVRLSNIRTELTQTNQVLAANRQNYDVMQRVTALKNKAIADQQNKSFDTMYAEAMRENRAFDANRRRQAKENDPDRAASRYLRTETALKNLELERTRVASNRTSIQRNQLKMMDEEIVRLRGVLQTLSQIQGVDQRILTLRAQQKKQGPTQRSPEDRIATRADLVGDYSALGAMTYAGYSVARYIVEDEKALAQFQAIASASNSETARLNVTLKQLGQETRFTNVELAQGATLLAQAGLSARDAEPALKSIAQLATAAGTEFQQAADVMTSVSNIWGYNTSQMGQTADILTAALNQTKLSMDQMQLGIQYAGNTAVDAGVDFVELTSIMGGMAQAGIRSGSTIGTGLRTLLTNLMDPTERTIATFERLGLSMVDVDVRTLGLTQVLMNLKQAGFTGADAMSAFEIRAASAFNAISNNLDTVSKLQTTLYDAGTAATANAVQMDTLSAKWITFSNAALAMSAEAFKPVLDALKVFLDIGREVVGVMSNMMPVMRGVATAAAIMVTSLAAARMWDASKALLAIAVGGRSAKAGLDAAAVGATATGVALKSIPFVGILSMISGLAVAALDLAGVFTTAGDRADKLDAAINDLKSELQESETTIKSVEQATEGLRNRQVALRNTTEDMRRNVLEQTRQRFENLGLQIDRGTTSVDNMIEALGRLQRELSKDYESQLLSLADQIEERIILMREDVEGYGAGIDGKRRREAFDSFRSVTNRGALAPEDEILNDAFGGRFYQLGKVVIGQAKLDTEEAISAYRTQVQDLRAYVREVEGKVREADVDSRERRTYEKELRALRTILSVANDPLRSLANIAMSEDQAADLERRAQVQSYMQDTQRIGFNAQRTFTERMDGPEGFRVRANAILRSEENNIQKSKKLKDLREEAESFAFNYLERIGRLLEEEAEGAPIRDEVMTELSAQFSRVLSMVFGGQEALHTQADRESRAADRASRKTEQETDDLTKRTDKADVDLLKAQLARLDAEIKALLANGAPSDRVQSLFDQWKTVNDSLIQAEAKYRGTVVDQSRAANRAGSLAIPSLRGGRVTSEFNPRRRHPISGEIKPHQGMDIAAAAGTPVPVSADGTVVFADTQGGYGKMVEVEHANGVRTLYAHLSHIAVKRGDKILQNAIIGNVGSTGNSTGNHLHYAVKVNGRFVNPRTASLGSGITSSDVETLAETESATAEQKGLARLLNMERTLNTALAKNEYQLNSASWKARMKANNTEIDMLISTLEATGDATTQLPELVQRIEELTANNVELSNWLLTEDPDNAGRLDTPAFRQQVLDTELEALTAGAEQVNQAFSAFLALKDRLAEDQAFNTSQQARLAEARQASGTARWLIEQRQEMETFQAAVNRAAAAQDALTEAMRRQLEVEGELLHLNDALRAAVEENDTAEVERLRQMIDQVEQLLGRATNATALARRQLDLANRNVVATTPTGPLATNAATASATSSSSWITDPRAAMVDTIEHFKKQSGVMRDAADSVADGIYASFEALSGGIETSINQLAAGSLTVKSLFSNIVGGVLQELQRAAAKIATNLIMQQILNMAMSWATPSFSNSGGGMNLGIAERGANMNFGSIRLRMGGEARQSAPARRFALGGQNGRDSVHALLEPGEIVMRKSAVDFIGREQLLKMNHLGNRKISDASSGFVMPPPKEKDEVNIWMVAPNQVPPPSKKDIIATVGDSISNGELRKLVKTVQVGR